MLLWFGDWPVLSKFGEVPHLFELLNIGILHQRKTEKMVNQEKLSRTFPIVLKFGRLVHCETLETGHFENPCPVKYKMATADKSAELVGF